MIDYKFLAFDLDGTLLNSQKKISEKALSVLQQKIKEGISVILISSRHYYEMKPYADALCLNENCFVVSCDGQYIYSGSGDLLAVMPFLHISDVENIFSLHNKTVSFYTDAHDYFYEGEKTYPFPKNIKKHQEEKQRVASGSPDKKWGRVNSLKLYKALDIEKIVVYNFTGANQLENKYNIISLADDRTEIMNKATGKYPALCYLDKNFNVDLNKLIYFGDDFNDLECFTELPFTAAMGNAKDEIKCKATYILDTNDNDGIYKFLVNLE